MTRDDAAVEVLNFLRSNHVELPTEDVAFFYFLKQSLAYLAGGETVRSFTLQKSILGAHLLPAERSGQGSFSFVLEHDLGQSEHLTHLGPLDPTIQISATSGNFHAVVLKCGKHYEKGYPLGDHFSFTIAGKIFEATVARRRIRTEVDLQSEMPDLYNLKRSCRSQGQPIIYFLGPARQFVDQSAMHESFVRNQAQAIHKIFVEIGNSFGDNVVIGTGGWAGNKEGSIGVPRMGYLEAVTREHLTLTTMPRIGAHDRHEAPTAEFFCGQEWGDDSAIIAAACDAAFVFSPWGTWTQIEVENLLAQRKTFVAIDDPHYPRLREDQRRAVVSVPRGSYVLYRDATEAAEDLLATLRGQGFEHSKRSALGPSERAPWKLDRQ